MPKSRWRCRWRVGACRAGLGAVTAAGGLEGEEAGSSTRRAFMTLSSALRGQLPEWRAHLRAAEQRLEGVAGVTTVADVAAAVAVADAEVAFAMQVADRGGLGGGSGLGGVVAAGFEGADVHGGFLWVVGVGWSGCDLVCW